jgi:hypothetical protein
MLQVAIFTTYIVEEFVGSANDLNCLVFIAVSVGFWRGFVSSL